jgi:MoaA/NifB/PqqE/SkfB family radical SAM enzyme
MVDKCVHQWGGVYINPEGFIQLCGISKEKVLGYTPPHMDDIENLQNFYASEYFKAQRNTPVADNPFCIACTRREDNGVKSLRYMMIDKYAKNDISESEVIRHLDICFSNLCNQQCMMCKSESSSRWYTDDKALEDSKFKRIPIKYRKWTKNNLHKIIEILPDLKILTIKGGEPLIQPEVHDILRHLRDNGLNPRIEILTNFQDITDEVIELLHSLTNAVLRISMDSHGEMYNWTRGGDFDDVVKNIQKYVAGCKHDPDLGYTNTLNRWSYRSLVEDIQVIEKITKDLGIGMKNYNIQPVMGPIYTSPFAAPREERLDLVNRFEREFGFIVGDSMEYGSLKINHLSNVLSLENDVYEIDNELIAKTDEWKSKIDEIRS